MKRRRAKKQRRIKRRGWVALILGALFLLAGLASGREEFYILAAIFCLLLLIALVQAALRRPGLKLDTGPGWVVCGQEAALGVLVKNNLPWPIFPVRLSLSLLRENQEPLELASYEIPLQGRVEKQLKATAICPHRGEYQIMLHRYYGEDIFGLFAMPGLSLPPQSLLSLPRLDLTVTADHKQMALEEEESQQGRPGLQGQLTAESRLYQRGDTLRSIHWKKTASRRTLFSRLHEYSADYSCCLLIDSSPCGQGEEALVYEDLLCESALSFLFSQLTHNRGVTLLPGNLSLQDLAGLNKAAALLAALPFSNGTALACLKAMLENQTLPDTLFLLLGQPAPQLTETLELIVNQGCAVICLCPATLAATVEDSLTLPIPLISIDPPFTATNWLEV